MKLTLRHTAAGILIAGGTVAAVAGAGFVSNANRATASQSQPVAQAGQASTSGSATPTAGAAGSYGSPGVHGPGAPFAMGGPGRGLTVTAVSGDTITAKDGSGKAVTVQVGTATTYSEAGTSASLADIKVGSIIAVRASSATAGSTIKATAITIVLPQVGGVVKSLNGSTLTVTGFDGTTRTVLVTGSTRYQQAGRPGSATAATASSVKVGVSIMAEGSLSSDGKTLTARRVLIMPAQGGPGMGGPGMGGPGSGSSGQTGQGGASGPSI